MQKMCSRCHKLIGILEQCNCIDKQRYKDYRNTRTDSKELRFYNSREWKVARVKVLELDNHLCLHCYLVDKTIRQADTVHHVIELKEDYSLRINKNNLISVCNSCHQIIHNEYKKNKINKEKMINKLFNLIKIYREK